MKSEKIQPWITEEYAQERDRKKRELLEKGIDPFNNKYTQEFAEELQAEMKRQSKANALKFRGRVMSELADVGEVEYTNHMIRELKAEILELENPSPEDSYKYTQAYFNDMIASKKDTLLFYEELLKDEDKLKEVYSQYKKRYNQLKKEIEELDIERDLNLESELIRSGILKEELLKVPKTCYPNEYIMPKDKISNMLFNGELTEELNSLRMERMGSKKELTAVVSIDYEGLEDIQVSRNFTPYDWEIHNSIVSLYVDGQNEYITPLMIYRTMTGNHKAELTDNIRKAISDSVTRCSFTRLKIDSTKEAKAWNMEQVIYEGNLIYMEKVTGIYNGNINEWIRILKRPMLYDYANSKNQVARMDIKLLNTPINKNEETITLQGYLQKRILDMKGSKLSRNILYDTVYKQLEIQAASPGALRKKQSKIRDSIKTILEFWEEKGFIKAFKENTGARNSKISVSIEL